MFDYVDTGLGCFSEKPLQNTNGWLCSDPVVILMNLQNEKVLKSCLSNEKMLVGASSEQCKTSTNIASMSGQEAVDIKCV